MLRTAECVLPRPRFCRACLRNLVFYKLCALYGFEGCHGLPSRDETLECEPPRVNANLVTKAFHIPWSRSSCRALLHPSTQVSVPSCSTVDATSCYLTTPRKQLHSPSQNFAGTAHGSGENGAEAQPKMGIPPSPPPLAPGSTNDRRSAGVARERKSTSRRTAPDISSELDARVTLRQDNADAVAIQLTSRESSPSPPPSAPTGRLADRIRSLRERCRLGLGAETFERAYRYLKVRGPTV